MLKQRRYPVPVGGAGRVRLGDLGRAGGNRQVVLEHGAGEGAPQGQTHDLSQHGRYGTETERHRPALETCRDERHAGQCRHGEGTGDEAVLVLDSHGRATGSRGLGGLVPRLQEAKDQQGHTPDAKANDARAPEQPDILVMGGKSTSRAAMSWP